MTEKGIDVLHKLLRPFSKAEVKALVRAQTGDSGGEQLSLADAGLEDEVRQFLAPDAHVELEEAITDVRKK